MIYILLIPIALAVSPRVLNRNLNTTTVNMIVNEERTLYEDPDNYQIYLWRRSKVEKRTQQFTREELDTLTQEQHKIEGVPGCIAIQKQFPTSQHLRMRLPANQTVFYTDTIVLQNRALLIRNDLTLQEVNLHEEKFTKTIKQQKLDIVQTQASHPIFIRNQEINRVYIVSESGGVSIPDWISIGAANFFINPEAFIKRKVLYDSYLKHNTIYLACGNEGLDVYKYENGKLLHDKVILRIGGYPLTAVDVSGDDTNLYILDHENGLYVCDYDFNVKFKVPILKGSDFDHYKSTFFIVAESVNRQDYAVEVFMNFTDNSFYVNHYYIDEMQFYDVKVYEKYAVLIGYEAHKIVQHSIYHDFIRETVNNFFEFQQMLQLRQWENYTLGLSKKELRLMSFGDVPAHVECQSNQKHEQHYLIVQFSKNGDNPYEAIETFQQFTLIVDDVAILSKANLILLGFILIILFIIVIIVILGIVCYKLIIKKNTKLEVEEKALTAKHKREIEEGTGQELTQM